MLDSLKIACAFLVLAGVGYQLAQWADRLSKPASGRGSVPAPIPIQKVEKSPAPVAVDDTPKGPTDSIVASFLDSDPAEGRATLGKKLTALDADELFIEALSFDLQDRRAFDAAGLAIEAIAEMAPTQALELLFALSPSEREKLVTSLARGWATGDTVSAWNWIDSSWIDMGGEFIDRTIQNRMFREALDVVLTERGDYQLAVNLLNSVVEPTLRLELADQIAFQVVSENPALTLDRLAFEGGELVDSAIMDAVIDEWAQRDSKGAMTWTLENERHVSSAGARMIAKDLLLNGVYQDLANFHGGLTSTYKRDAVASESARLLARRDPSDSIVWLGAIEMQSTRLDAYYDSLYTKSAMTIFAVPWTTRKWPIAMRTLTERLSSWRRSKAGRL